ncbi:polyprenyl synthetase family protein [Yoonia sp. 2307UL14-13]|uniref:polyprenyl synthetase family protein n=1 Tax=Yoonia sp. 2307UL14-13 TaxID=3126506 RepID=UPI0030AD5F0F
MGDETVERMSFGDTLKNVGKRIDGRRAEILLHHGGTLPQAMTYALSGGKFFRAFLALEGCRLHAVADDAATDAALAIECIHAYSLVHDDLPCMDDDDLRRGLPTVHKQWNEAVAVLAGDALQALAFDLMLHHRMGPHRSEAARVLARSAQRMVSGQMQDIEAETADEPLSLKSITQLQSSKTGALINWAATIGPQLAAQDTSALNSYANALGLAFQIADDILDVEGDAATVGKAVGKDADAGKATFVSHLGLDGAKRRAGELVQEACDALSIYGDDAETLKEAARFVITRTH